MFFCQNNLYLCQKHGQNKKTIIISRYITKLLLTLHHQKLVLRTTNAQLLKEHIIQKH